MADDLGPLPSPVYEHSNIQLTSVHFALINA